MKHLFEEISPDSLLVVVTHKLALLPHVNRIIVVDKGKIIMDGPRDQVIQSMQQGARKSNQKSTTQENHAGATA